MCELCSDDKVEREKAINDMLHTAIQLERLAGLYKLMAWGKIAPHSDEAKKMSLSVRSVFRQLIEWI
jgi:hypothetical protein